MGTSNCDQLCNNTIGSFTCDCRDGYILAADMFTCEGEQLMRISWVVLTFFTPFICGPLYHEDIHVDFQWHDCVMLWCSTLTKEPGCIIIIMILIPSDIDECQSRELNRCEQNCINSNGSFHCDCVIGFILSPNRFDCSGTSFNLLVNLLVKFQFLAVCPDEFDSGLWWPVTVESTAFSQSCNEAGLHFRAGEIIIALILYP